MLAASRFMKIQHLVPLLLLAANCLAGPATNIKVYITGFPDAHIAPLEGNQFSGTDRCFKGDDGELFYVEIFFHHSFDSYCTEQLKAAGINDFEIELGRMSYEQQENRVGFQPHPDRIDLSFILHYKARPSQRDIHFVYMLPASSQSLGQSAGFSKLGRDKQTELCVESVTADMKSIADQLVQRLKNGPIKVGPLLIPYDPAAERTKRKPSDNDYNIGFVNKTGQNLYDLSLSYEEQEVCAIPDVVTRMKLERSDNMALRIPAQTTLRWKQAVGLPWNDSVTKHSVTVPFGVVPPDFSKGTIYFVIREHDVVEVKPIKWTDDKASIKLMKEK
jgi:hypothetical protein